MEFESKTHLSMTIGKAIGFASALAIFATAAYLIIK